MGVILDIFQSFGTLPEEFTRCSEIEVEQSLSILAEMFRLAYVMVSISRLSRSHVEI